MIIQNYHAGECGIAGGLGQASTARVGPDARDHTALGACALSTGVSPSTSPEINSLLNHYIACYESTLRYLYSLVGALCILISGPPYKIRSNLILMFEVSRGQNGRRRRALGRQCIFKHWPEN
jgi:hypothetical protein